MSAGKENPDSRNSPMHFARYEFKYILTAKKRVELEKDLHYFVELDPFVQNIPNHKYVVRSLYYDDPFNSAFHDKIDGLFARSKFRIRTYDQHAETMKTLFLEIKGRHNNLVFKHRTPVKINGFNWGALHNGGLAKAIFENAEPCPVADQFYFDSIRKKLQPVALIDYERRPYFSKYDHNFRLTFDDHLRALATNTLFPNKNVTPKDILSGYTVLEMKFKHQTPSWFHRLIQTHELQKVSLSKICAGMEVLGIEYDESN